MTKVRRHYASVMATLAFFVALGGGAYAITHAPKNSVVSKSIKNGQVRKADLGANAVNGGKVADGSLGGADINESTLGEVPSARTLDGIGSEAFSRVASSGIASNAIPAPSGGSGTARQVSITAPRDGFLLAIASARVFNNNDIDDFQCILNLDGADQSQSRRTGELREPTVNEGTCDTNSVLPVAKGPHLVQFNFSDLDNTTVVDAAELDVVFIPFAG